MSKKDVSSIVSGAGWLCGFADKLVNALHERGVSDETIHCLVTENGDVPVKKIADVLFDYFLNSGKARFPVNVDYDRSIEDAIKAGDYKRERVNQAITSKNFPTERRGKKDYVIQILDLGFIKHKDALQEIEKRGFRPAEPHELLALGEKYPDLQRKFTILALGSMWLNPLDSHKHFGVVGLHSFGSERELKLYQVVGFWTDSCRFAVIRK